MRDLTARSFMFLFLGIFHDWLVLAFAGSVGFLPPVPFTHFGEEFLRSLRVLFERGQGILGKLLYLGIRRLFTGRLKQRNGFRMIHHHRVKIETVEFTRTRGLQFSEAHAVTPTAIRFAIGRPVAIGISAGYAGIIGNPAAPFANGWFIARLFLRV